MGISHVVIEIFKITEEVSIFIIILLAGYFFYIIFSLFIIECLQYCLQFRFISLIYRAVF